MSCRPRRPQEGQRDLELLAEDRQRPLDAGLATGGERPQDRPADQDAPGAERQRDRDVEATADAAVDPHLGPAVDGRDDLLQDVDRRRNAVELAGSVVRDDDRVGPVLDGEACVLGGQDPLEDERQRRPASDRRRCRPRPASSVGASNAS